MSLKLHNYFKYNGRKLNQEVSLYTVLDVYNRQFGSDRLLFVFTDLSDVLGENKVIFTSSKDYQKKKKL